MLKIDARITPLENDVTAPKKSPSWPPPQGSIQGQPLGASSLDTRIRVIGGEESAFWVVPCSSSRSPPPNRCFFTARRHPRWRHDRRAPLCYSLLKLTIWDLHLLS